MCGVSATAWRSGANVSLVGDTSFIEECRRSRCSALHFNGAFFRRLTLHCLTLLNARISPDVPLARHRDKSRTATLWAAEHKDGRWARASYRHNVLYAFSRAAFMTEASNHGIRFVLDDALDSVLNDNKRALRLAMLWRAVPPLFAYRDSFSALLYRRALGILRRPLRVYCTPRFTINAPLP